MYFSTWSLANIRKISKKFNFDPNQLKLSTQHSTQHKNMYIIILSMIKLWLTEKYQMLTILC